MVEQAKQQTARRQNSEQKRGAQAWKDVREIKDADRSEKKDLEKEYRSLARGLNAMIQINGLGQTLGFLKAKGKGDPKKAHFLLLKHLTEWMSSADHFKAANGPIIENGADGLLLWVVNEGTSSADYRRATTECMAFGIWLRRFAEAELKAPEGEGEAS